MADNIVEISAIPENNNSDPLDRAIFAWEEGGEKEAGQLVRHAAQEYVERNPDRKYAGDFQAALRVNYETPITQVLYKMLASRIEKGADLYTAIKDLAQAVSPPYSQNPKALRIADNRSKTIEEMLAFAGEGIACRHQADITAKIAHIWTNPNGGEVRTVSFPPGTTADRYDGTVGHQLVELISRGETSFIDTTNPHLSVSPKPHEAALSALWQLYNDKGIHPPYLESSTRTTPTETRTYYPKT